MILSKLVVLLLLVPTSALLAISFLVLFVNGKVENKNLKKFGWFVAVYIWIAVLLILIGGAILGYKGSQKMHDFKCNMMMHKMHMGVPGMSGPMEHPGMGEGMKKMMPYHHMKMMPEKK